MTINCLSCISGFGGKMKPRSVTEVTSAGAKQSRLNNH